MTIFDVQINTSCDHRIRTDIVPEIGAGGYLAFIPLAPDPYYPDWMLYLNGEAIPASGLPVSGIPASGIDVNASVLWNEAAEKQIQIIGAPAGLVSGYPTLDWEVSYNINQPASCPKCRGVQE